MSTDPRSHRTRVDPPEVDLLKAVEVLRVDAVTASIVTAMEERGVSVVLLKGPAIAEWLYVGGPIRGYGDTDLLVPAHEWARASETLRALGFEDDLEALGHPRMESFTSYPWVRGRDHVDLHSTLWGIGADPERVWGVLCRETSSMRVGGRQVPVLAPGPRALHVGLHVAQHGPEVGKPIRDLQRAIEQLPHEVWIEAAAIAGQLGAGGAFATGLKGTPEGVELADRLGVAGESSVDALIRAAHVPLVEGLEELATTPGLRAKLALLRTELFPTPRFMRWWSPLARRGRVGLGLAYFLRPLWFVVKAGPALLAWRRVRRKSSWM